MTYTRAAWRSRPRSSVEDNHAGRGALNLTTLKIQGVVHQHELEGLCGAIRLTCGELVGGRALHIEGAQGPLAATSRVTWVIQIGPRRTRVQTAPQVRREDLSE
jgi:hypothetical protein